MKRPLTALLALGCLVASYSAASQELFLLASSSSNTSVKYERKHFGHGWSDEDRDCQNTRAELLTELSINTVTYKRKDGCVVERGAWRSYFTNAYINQASKVDIDHVVPLHWAWSRGAADWSKAERKAFSNDYTNLIVVEKGLNRSKGSKGIDRWLPPANQCQYILRFKRVVLKYSLLLTYPEQNVVDNLRARHCMEGKYKLSSE